MSKEFDLLFVGPDSVLKEYFRDIADGYSFREAADGSNSLQQVGSGDSKSEIVVLWEKTTIDRDLSAIRAFRKTRGNVYLILIGNELTPDERSGYLKAGVNDTMLRHIPKEQFVSRLSFIQQTREMILGKREKASQEAICHFRLPLWKRLFVGRFAVAVAVAAADDAGNPTGKQRRGGLSFQEGGKQLPGVRFPEIPVDVCGG